MTQFDVIFFHFGIDPSKLKKHHMNKETKQELLQQLATMQKSTPGLMSIPSFFIFNTSSRGVLLF
jgi:trehalose-6-phosphate synthase